MRLTYNETWSNTIRGHVHVAENSIITARIMICKCANDDLTASARSDLPLDFQRCSLSFLINFVI